MNVMHNMIILYYNSIFSKLKDPDTSAQKFILEQSDLFEKCAKKLRPATFESAGGLVKKDYVINIYFKKLCNEIRCKS